MILAKASETAENINSATSTFIVVFICLAIIIMWMRSSDEHPTDEH